MIDYYGDISRQDAGVLKSLAENSKTGILEFGVGASTQVLRYYSTVETMVSVETEEAWIARTIQNLDRIGCKKPIQFHLFHRYQSDTKFDLIFDDLIDDFRLEVALNFWPNLEVGGILAIHDTRRIFDIKNVCAVIENFFPEIESVQINAEHSNITLIKKKLPEYYENWNDVEGRSELQSGYSS